MILHSRIVGLCCVLAAYGPAAVFAGTSLRRGTPAVTKDVVRDRVLIDLAPAQVKQERPHMLHHLDHLRQGRYSTKPLDVKSPPLPVLEKDTSTEDMQQADNLAEQLLKETVAEDAKAKQAIPTLAPTIVDQAFGEDADGNGQEEIKASDDPAYTGTTVSMNAEPSASHTVSIRSNAEAEIEDAFPVPEVPQAAAAVVTTPAIAAPAVVEDANLHKAEDSHKKLVTKLKSVKKAWSDAKAEVAKIAASATEDDSLGEAAELAKATKLWADAESTDPRDRDFQKSDDDVDQSDGPPAANDDVGIAQAKTTDAVDTVTVDAALDDAQTDDTKAIEQQKTVKGKDEIVLQPSATKSQKKTSPVHKAADVAIMKAVSAPSQGTVVTATPIKTAQVVSKVTPKTPEVAHAPPVAATSSKSKAVVVAASHPAPTVAVAQPMQLHVAANHPVEAVAVAKPLQLSIGANTDTAQSGQESAAANTDAAAAQYWSEDGSAAEEEEGSGSMQEEEDVGEQPAQEDHSIDDEEHADGMQEMDDMESEEDMEHDVEAQEIEDVPEAAALLQIPVGLGFRSPSRHLRRVHRWA